MSNEDINRLPNNPGTERAENLLGSRYNPMEYADIKSYFKPEETSARLNHLEQALEGKTPDSAVNQTVERELSKRIPLR